MNKVLLVGRLAQQPELRYTQNGVAVARFTVAVNRPYTNPQGERDADFIDVVVWRAQAENCANYLAKGRLVGVEGRLQIRSYETAEGQKRRVAEVVADRVEFLDRGKEGGQSGAEEGGGQRLEDGADADDQVPF